ncbi:hypothetical protein P4O66_021098 [Electrophorus voltai]|uniref:Endonuclease/exonuclease/phosphatase domain-containing protein n=1 Tax=Electrophorus voltai TaxID=2609070 RepID=A0AAD8ZRC8_9TELE|nr:hypothetical protein P4O66_021098 [Electrophorus voltai]
MQQDASVCIACGSPRHHITGALRRSPQCYHHRRRNLSNLTDSQCSAPSHIVVAGGLWQNSQSAVQKADFISALPSLHFLHFLALTETWITRENSATPATLSSAFSSTHSPRRLSRGGGTGLLMSPEWRFTPLSFSTLSISSFEFHAITVSFPTKLLIIVIYRPAGSLDHFIDELDILLSQFPIEGNPLILLGDLPSDKLHSSCILLLLTAFDLTLNHSPLTHKAGNVLDLIFTRTITTSDISHPHPPLGPSLSILLSLPSFSFHPVLPNVFLLPLSQSNHFWLLFEMVSVLSARTVLSDSSFVTYEGFLSRRKLPSEERHSHRRVTSLPLLELSRHGIQLRQRKKNSSVQVVTRK